MDKISWIADEYHHHERDIGWYAGLFLFGVILVVWALYTNDIITTILFAIIVVIIYALSHHKPAKVMVELSNKGVTLNNEFYSYDHLKHFWILNHDTGSELTIENNSILNRHLTIKLEDQNPIEVRMFLRQHIEEVEDYEENFVDFLIRKLKL